MTEEKKSYTLDDVIEELADRWKKEHPDYGKKIEETIRREVYGGIVECIPTNVKVKLTCVSVSDLLET